MLKFACCPIFYAYSWIFFITLIDIIVYISTVIYEFNKYRFFEPTYGALQDFGASENHKIREGQVFRFITPMFLHANLVHLALNMASQLVLGFRIEPQVGIYRIVALYIVAGVAGNLLSDLIREYGIAVGASTAVFGMMASMFAWLWINW